MRGVFNVDMNLLTIYDVNTEIAEFELKETHDEDVTLAINTHEYFTFDVEELALFHYMHGANPVKLKVKLQ